MWDKQKIQNKGSRANNFGELSGSRASSNEKQFGKVGGNIGTGGLELEDILMREVWLESKGSDI